MLIFDHYYLVMGVPEKYSSLFDFSFLRIPLTEECKLLPATGIYAVSVISGEVNSKGMAVVCVTQEGTAGSDSSYF